MVERSLSMREAPGSIPGFSIIFSFSFFFLFVSLSKLFFLLTVPSLMQPRILSNQLKSYMNAQVTFVGPVISGPDSSNVIVVDSVNVTLPQGLCFN